MSAETDRWLDRDWQRAAESARANPALQKVIDQLEADALQIMIASGSQVARETARQRVLALRLIMPELEQMAAKLTKPERG